jgi:hypothetical protein
MTGGEQGGERAAFRDSKQMRAFDADRVHDGAKVVHSLVHVRQVQAGAALVEQDDAAEAADLGQRASEMRLVPVIFNVGNEARRDNQIGAIAEHLIGDMDVAALRISRDGVHAERPSGCWITRLGDRSTVLSIGSCGAAGRARLAL